MSLTTTFHEDVSKLAYNEIAYSLGSIVCGLLINKILVQLKEKLGLSSVSFYVSISIILLAYCVRWFPIYCTFMFLASFFINMFQIQIITVLQKKSSQANRILVFSKLEMLTNIALPMGMLLWGAISDVITVEYSLVYSGVALLLFSFVGKITLRMGRFDKPQRQGNC